MDKKLRDFREFGMGALRADSMRGTVGYMAPELILLNHYSRATDMWAAGVVLCVLLTGVPLFSSRSNR